MRVLVHADDLGMSPEVNAAVFAAWRAGTLRSASVLATGPAAEAALAAAPAGLDLGLHLDFTGYPALTGAPELARVRERAATDGAGAMAELAGLARARPALLRDEAEAQLHRLAAARRPSHLDSHQHVHWQPALWPVVEGLLRDRGVPAVRQVGAWRPSVHPLRAWPQRLRALRFRRRFARWVHTDGFCDATTFRALLGAGALGDATVEVMVHPGNPAHARYSEELAWMAGDWGGRRAAADVLDWPALVCDDRSARRGARRRRWR